MTNTILFLSGASLVGQNVLQALHGRRSSLKLVATNSLPSDPSLPDFDSVVMVPQTQSAPEGFDAIIEHLIDDQKPSLTIPCRDDDVVALARLASRRPDLAPRLLCGSNEAAIATVDKWASWEFSRAWDLPFVPTIVPDCREAVENFAATHGFPLLVKPRQGFASRGVSIILNANQLPAVTGHDAFLLQRYIGDPVAVSDYVNSILTQGVPLFHSFESVKHSYQAMIGQDGAIIGEFATDHLMSQGISNRVSPSEAPELLALGKQCAVAFANAGWRGPLNVQCQRTPDGELLIYEFNGRFTGATAARTLLGYDEASLALAHFAQLDLPRLSNDRARCVIKQPVSRMMNPEIQNRLETCGVWNRASTPSIDKTTSLAQSS